MGWSKKERTFLSKFSTYLSVVNSEKIIKPHNIYTRRMYNYGLHICKHQDTFIMKYQNCFRTLTKKTVNNLINLNMYYNKKLGRETKKLFTRSIIFTVSKQLYPHFQNDYISIFIIELEQTHLNNQHLEGTLTMVTQENFINGKTFKKSGFIFRESPVDIFEMYQALVTRLDILKTIVFLYPTLQFAVSS